MRTLMGCMRGLSALPILALLLIAARVESLLPRQNSIPASYAAECLMNDSYSIATLLLGTLLESREEEFDRSISGILSRLNPSFHAKKRGRRELIQEYIKILCDMPTKKYDPTKSLFGPLFCTLFYYNPSKPSQEAPLWERISLKPENLKGQQYFLNSDFEMSIINYAEILGKSFAVRAKATFSPLEKQSKTMDTTAPLSLFGTGVMANQSLSPVLELDPSPPSALRSCPDVYNVRAFAGEIVLGNTFIIPIPIEGEAKLVVLYADPRLRIFVSADRSDSAVGAWEQAGLVVVQVRSDLVTGSGPVDLR